MTSPTVPSPRALTEEKLAAVLSDADTAALVEGALRARWPDGSYDGLPTRRTAPIVVAAMEPVVTDLIRAHLAQALAQAIDAAGDEGAADGIDLEPFVDRLAGAQYRDLDSHAAFMSWDEYKADDPTAAGGLYRDPMRRYVLRSLPWLPIRPAPAPREAAEREALAERVRALADEWQAERYPDTGDAGWNQGYDIRRESDIDALRALLPTPHEGDSAEVGSDG